MWYAYYVTKNSQDVVRFCNMIGNSDIQSRYLLRDIADTYLIFEKPREALGVFEKISEINESWGEEWRHKAYYFQYSRCCFILGLNDRGKRILQKGLKIFPDDPELLLSKAMYGGFIKDTTVVNKTLATVAEERSWTALDMNQTKAYIYNETGTPTWLRNI